LGKSNMGIQKMGYDAYAMYIYMWYTSTYVYIYIHTYIRFHKMLTLEFKWEIMGDITNHVILNGI
jgi:hypothetical protein